VCKLEARAGLHESILQLGLEQRLLEDAMQINGQQRV
jgi:hypothetical protein